MELFNLTPEEKSAIQALKRVAKIWPKSLWLFSASGSLCVMRKKSNGTRAMISGGKLHSGGVDPNYRVDTIYGIDNDGGDW